MVGQKRVGNPYEDFNALDELENAAYAPESFPLLAGIYRWSVVLTIFTGVLGFLGFYQLALYLFMQSDLFRNWWDFPLLMLPVFPLFVFCIRAVVFFMIFLYRLWEIVQDGHARTTPQRMIWRLIIPLYNLYWIFVAVAGIGREMADYCRRHALKPCPNLRRNTRVAVVACIFLLIPGLNLLAPLLLIPVLNAYARQAEQIQIFRFEGHWNM